MKPSTAYRQYHPKWYRTRVPTLWWSRKWPYLKFMLRELSSVFVAFYVVILLLQLHALRGGPETYLEFQHWLTNPLLVVLNGISFLFVLFHAVTWFNLTPKAMAVRWRGKRLPICWWPLPTTWPGWRFPGWSFFSSCDKDKVDPWPIDPTNPFSGPSSAREV